MSSTPIYRGFCKDSLAKSYILRVWVAENNTVCLYLGSTFTISDIYCSKPILRSASASSITKQKRLWWMNLEFCKWSKSLPGVQIRRLTPFSNLKLSIFLFIPPISSPMVLLWNSPTFFATSKTWIASYLVGNMMITPVPLICLNSSYLSFSKQGIR